MNFIYPFFLSFLAGCVLSQKQSHLRFSYAGGDTGLGHMLKVKSKVNGKDTLLIFDTGIGVNIISEKLCLELGCKIEGQVKGKRMTGQSVTVPMSKVKSLKVANQKDLDVEVGVLDLTQFLPQTKEFEGVEGYLSLNFFKNRPFTIDYKQKRLLFESPLSMLKRQKNAEVISIIKNHQDQALTIQVLVKTQIQKTLNMQLDLGTDIMTISSKYLEKFKPYFINSTLKEQSIIDETKFNRNRIYVKLKRNIGLSLEGVMVQTNPSVMFQDIIYDGIIGNDFFKNKVVTYDLKNSRLLINP